MAKGRKTKKEKIESQYRLKDIRVQRKKRRIQKDKEDFEYLSSKYIRKDLVRTFIFAVLILGLQVYLSTIL